MKVNCILCYGGMILIMIFYIGKYLFLVYIFIVYSLFLFYLWVIEESSWVEVVFVIFFWYGLFVVKYGFILCFFNIDDVGVDEVIDVDVGEGVYEILEWYFREKVYLFVNI